MIWDNAKGEGYVAYVIDFDPTRPVPSCNVSSTAEGHLEACTTELRKGLKARSEVCGSVSDPPSFSEFGGPTADPSRGRCKVALQASGLPLASRAALSDCSQTTGK